MKRFLFKIVIFILPFMVAAIILLQMPIDKKFAYTTIENSCYNRGAYVYSRIFENPEPIDVAFIGTSHTMCAINDSILTASSPNYTYANVTFCWQGVNTEYVILKDLLKHKSPKFVVFEVREREENVSNKVFPYIADGEDIFAQPYFKNKSTWGNFFNAIFTRVDALRTNNEIIIDSLKQHKLFGYEPRGETADVQSLQQMAKNQLKNYNKVNGRYLNDTLSGYTAYYFEAMMQLCKEYNAQPIFLYLPNYGDILKKPINSATYEKYGKIIAPPPYLMKAYENWSDGSHVNELGAYRISVVLSGAFENVFESNQ